MEPYFHPWPEHLAEQYERKGYWRKRTLGDHLRAWAAAFP